MGQHQGTQAVRDHKIVGTPVFQKQQITYFECVYLVISNNEFFTNPF